MPEEIVSPILPEQPTESVVSGDRSESLSVPETEPQVETAMERGSEQYAKILSAVQPGQTAKEDNEVDTDAHAVGSVEAAEQKVHKLIELAQVKGVAHAVRVAKRMNDLYVLDTMHDELADKLYEGLLSKGLITKE